MKRDVRSGERRERAEGESNRRGENGRERGERKGCRGKGEEKGGTAREEGVVNHL